MKNLLFISSYPFPLDKGSSQHAYYFLKALGADFNIYCIFFVQPDRAQPGIPDTVLAVLNIKDYRICHFSPAKKRGRLGATLRRIGAFPSPYMNRATNPAGMAAIEHFTQNYAIDIVHIEHFHYAKYAFRIGQEIKKVVVYHDLHHAIYEQKAQFEKGLIQKALLVSDCWKYYLFERWLDHHVDGKVFLNAEEMTRLPCKSVHIPHVANQAITYRPPRESEDVNILFIGAYKHPPNVMSVQYIIRHILPLLAARTERFKIHLVGSGTDQFQPLSDDSGFGRFIVIRGFVDDINQAMENMDIALFPILYGGGVKTKIIDAMAAGIPVVTTSLGIHGLYKIPTGSVCIGNSPLEIGQQVFRLMNLYELRCEMSLKAREYVRKVYSYESFSSRVKNSYNRLS